MVGGWWSHYYGIGFSSFFYYFSFLRWNRLDSNRCVSFSSGFRLQNRTDIRHTSGAFVRCFSHTFSSSVADHFVWVLDWTRPPPAPAERPLTNLLIHTTPLSSVLSAEAPSARQRLFPGNHRYKKAVVAGFVPKLGSI